MNKCLVEGCDRGHCAKGYCRLHYYRLKETGSLELRAKPPRKTCKAPNCTLFTVSLGYCHTHYMKIRRSGTLEPLVFGPEWKTKQALGQRTELSGLDPRPDPRPGYRGTYANNVVNAIKSKAVKRKIGWSLSGVETYTLIIGDCSYCGKSSGWPETRNGIDRQDIAIGYVISNCVSCCWTCNAAKNNMSLDQFKLWVLKVYERLLLQD